jgi:hypothetical protein
VKNALRALRYVLQEHRREAPLSPCDHELFQDGFARSSNPATPTLRVKARNAVIPHEGFRGDVLQVAAFAEEPVELGSRTMNMLAIVALIA